MSICTDKLLTILDFSNPSLIEAKRLLEQGNREGALEAVATHFRNRTNPKYLFEVSEFSQIDDDQIINDAQAVMRHEIYGHSFNGPIDWLFNPTIDTSRDNEWSWSLFRTIFWQPLARAYAITGDDAYVQEIIDQMKSFRQAWPAQPFIDADDEKPQKTPFPGHAWRTIETGIRIYTTWLPVFQIIRTSKAMDVEALAMFLCSMHDSGTFLQRHYSNHTHSSNWLSMEASSLLQLGIMFPEMSDAAVWKHDGYQRIMHEVAYCFDNDGVHMEHTPIYHLVASIAFLQAVRMCQLNGIVVAPYAMTLLERSAEYLMRIMKPDFSTPMIGDADRTTIEGRRCDTSLYEGMNLSFYPHDINELRAYFNQMADLTGRNDFRYIASAGREGTQPQHLDFAMQETGLYVMRTGWGRTDNYMHVHGVQLERGEKSTHSHNDVGHLELMLQGEDILIDSGRYIYNSSCWKDWRHYFTGSLAHNTLYVDDHCMGDVPGVTRVRGVRMVIHSFKRDKDYFLIDVSHNGYAFMDDPVFHRRKVVMLPRKNVVIIFDSISGICSEKHDMRLSWNFAGTNLERTSHQTYRFITKTGKQYDIMGTGVYQGRPEATEWVSQLYCGSEDPQAGWVSYGYPVREPIAQIQTCLQGFADATYTTVIAPSGTAVSIQNDNGQTTIQVDTASVSLNQDTVEVRQ